ncbi:MAG: metal ABC transporter permease [Armatimonadota bacterium]|nr:metal ABC transporter permease [Armatimonadota bacterium]MDR5701977.1 metal ABC transporter permease [Armatimonadota bacterium]MDR7434725.1 metal ABC transporter permease [Armatimonadota bacterium]
MPEFLQYGFMQRAFLAGIIIAAIAPMIGIFLVLRRLSLIADTLAHVALAGVAVGLLVGVNPVLAALLVAVLGAMGIDRLRATGRLPGEVALALFLSGGLAVATVLISLGRGFTVGLFGYLFGSITTVTPADLWLALALGGTIALSVLLLYRELFAITFNEETARISGIPVDSINLLLSVLTALTVVIGMRLVGVLLISALLVIPTVVGIQVARNFRQALGIAILHSVSSVIVGLLLSYYLDLAAGGAIVLSALVLFALLAFARRVL